LFVVLDDYSLISEGIQDERVPSRIGSSQTNSG
jgi:hypothetical protein